MKVTEPEDARPYMLLYRATIAEAVGGSGALMHRLVAHVRSELREQESQARERRERERLTHSRRLLNQHEATLCERFTEELLTAFNRQSSFDRVAPAAQALHFDQVGSMDDAQVQHSVEAARVKQSVQKAAGDGALTELNRLICTLLGLPEVRLERNPLRPAVYVEAVTAALSHLPVPPVMRLSWITMMSRALGHELDVYYRSLCEDLSERGVGDTGPAQRPAAVAKGPVALDAPAKVVVTLEKLRQLLLNPAIRPPTASAVRFDQRGVTSGAVDGMPGSLSESSAFGATVPAALDALADMRQLDAVVQRLEDRGAAAPRTPEVLRRSAQGLDQALGLEVVTMMVDNITHDTRLLGPVQRLVAELEPALLQLALVDPRFFSHKQHPARRLLHEITHRSIAFESEDSRGFSGFMEPLRAAVAPLTHDAIATADPFDRALERLVGLLDDPQGSDSRRRGKAMEALRQAEQRNMLAETIVAEVLDHSDAQDADPLVRAFLCGPWAQVVAHARITDATGAIDPGEYAQAIEEVLGLASEGATAAPAADRTHRLNALLERLRAGLASIAYPLADAEAVFEHLAQAQRFGAGQSAAPETARGSLGTTRQQAVDSLWLAPTEAQASGFIDLSSVLQPLPSTLSSGPMDALVLGVWVALQTEGGWTRTRLIWISPGGSLLLFSDALGFMQSLSARACRQLFAAGRLRILSNDPVQDALDAVAETALRNSVDVRF
ncbi:MAG: DUF1631 family protein [Burkholderiaceae bacterium]